jgi:DNA-binding GntR family transcriptional regulator
MRRDASPPGSNRPRLGATARMVDGVDGRKANNIPYAPDRTGASIMGRKLSLNGDALKRLAKPDSLSERIYGDLRARLQRCEVAEGDRLVDTEIAAAYGTSRMPVREALLRLANEGYLVGTTRGFTLPRLTPQDVRDIFQVRRLLEPAAAGLAARDLDASGLADLGAALEEARAAVAEGDHDRLILSNVRFRAAWLSGLSNRRLADTIARFVDHVQTVRLGTLADPNTGLVVLQGLEALHDAFAKRDARAAARRMAAFMDEAERAFERARGAARPSGARQARQQAGPGLQGAAR